jgi:hypothetical protein
LRDGTGHSATETGRAVAMTIGKSVGLGSIATALAQRAKHARPVPSPPQSESGSDGMSLAATAVAFIVTWLAANPCAPTLMAKSIAVANAMNRRLKQRAIGTDLPPMARPRKHKVVTRTEGRFCSLGR